MWTNHGDEFTEVSRLHANMLHAPLAMSLCRVDYAHLKLQASLAGHVYQPANFEGILELRKEKSRDAARSRRGKENFEFYELAKLLPLPAAITSQLDKASIIRLAISYLRLREFSDSGDPPWNRDGSLLNKTLKAGQTSQRHSSILVQDIFEAHQGTHLLQSIDGFTFALSNDGRFLYISETVSIYLGLSQVEMTGSSIFDYVHTHDHLELANQLGLSSAMAHFSDCSSPSPKSDASDDALSETNSTKEIVPDKNTIFKMNLPTKESSRCFCIRMKSTLTKRGAHIKSSGYRVVQIVSHSRHRLPYNSNTSADTSARTTLGLTAIAIALPSQSTAELLIDGNVFVTRLNPQLTVTYCEPRISDLLDLSSEDLVQQSLYQFCHAEDLPKLRRAHVDLLNKGQTLTDYYRLMTKHGGYVWLQTCATVICSTKNNEDLNMVAINHILGFHSSVQDLLSVNFSSAEHVNCIMSLDQLKNTDAEETDKGSKVCNVLSKESSNNCLHENIRSKRSTCGRAQELDMCNFDRIPVCQKDVPNPSAVQLSTLFQEKSKTKEQHLDVTQRKPDNLSRKRKHMKDTMTKSKILKQNQVEEPMESNVAPTLDVRQEASFNPKGDLPSVMMDQNKSHGKPKLKIANPSLMLDNLVSRSNRSDNSSKLVNSKTSAISTPSNNLLVNSATVPNVPALEQDIVTKDVDEVNCVLHLEEAMNRHLPDSEKNGDGDGFPCQSPLKKQRPAIQWISSHEPPQASLPASTLLRSLHANRESVIRTNVFTPQYYSDMQCSISTPANYKDPFGSSSLGYNRVSTPTNYETTDYISSRLSSTIDGYLVSTSLTSPRFSNSRYFEGSNGQHRYSSIDACNIPFKPQPYSLPIYPNCQLTSYESPSPPYAHSYYNSSLGLSAYNAVKSSKVYMSFDAD